MKQNLRFRILPFLALLLGAVGFLLCRTLFQTCFDEQNLPIPGMAVTLLPCFLIAAGILLLVLSLLTPVETDCQTILYGGKKYIPSFFLGSAGYLASGIALVMERINHTSPVPYEGYILPVVTAIGPFLAAGSLLWLALGRKFDPVFLILPGFSACFWLLDAYHGSANDPIALRFGWLILAAAAVSVAWYLLSGFAVGKAHGRATLFVCLLSIVLCLTALQTTTLFSNLLLLGTNTVCLAVLACQIPKKA